MKIKDKMKTISIKQATLLFVMIMAFSQSFAQYEITKKTINIGSTNNSGGAYVLTSSMGQTDASDLLNGGQYQLNGGFWHQNNDLIFKNGIEN